MMMVASADEMNLQADAPVSPTGPRAERSLRLRLAALGLALITLGGGVAGCAHLVVGTAVAGTALVVTDRRTSGAQLEDQGIEIRAGNRVREQLGERARVAVNSYNRQALITGEVASEDDKALVGRLVAGVDNVAGIVNELTVGPVSNLSQRSSDTFLSGRVKAALVDAQDLSSTAFKVVTQRGTVYLMGRVTAREADRATAVVRSLSGVDRVVRVFDVITEEELARLAPPPSRPTAVEPAQSK